MNRLIEFISQSISNLLNNQEIANDLSNVKFVPGDLLLINNSFIFREKTSIKTNKSDQYLAIQIMEDGTFSEIPIVISGLKINSDWKRFPQSVIEDMHELRIENAIENELSQLGRLVYILIGSIDDSVILKENISSSHFSELTWDPNNRSPVTIRGDSVIVKDAMDEEYIWQEVKEYHELNKLEIPEELRDSLAIALEKLKSKAVANLVLPLEDRPIQGSMIDSIITVLQEQRDEYEEALTKAQRRNLATNDVLRIAYNFASDALIFIRIMISICDLKPLVYWGTLNEHYVLAKSLKNLPWHTQQTKPSLQNYRKTIADARNSAFHNLFPFRKSLQINLPDATLQDTVLQIFSEHGRKRDNQLIYQDKELVDLLFEFTRARERKVSLSFWRRNLSVMDATIDLCKSTGDYLKLILHISDR